MPRLRLQAIAPPRQSNRPTAISSQSLRGEFRGITTAGLHQPPALCGPTASYYSPSPRTTPTRLAPQKPSVNNGPAVHSPLPSFRRTPPSFRLFYRHSGASRNLTPSPKSPLSMPKFPHPVHPVHRCRKKMPKFPKFPPQNDANPLA